MADKNDIYYRVIAKDESSAAFQALSRNVEKTERQMGSLKNEMASISSSKWGQTIAEQSKPAVGSITFLRTELKRVKDDLESMPAGSSKFAAYTSLATHLKSELEAARKPLRDLESGAGAVGHKFGSSTTLAQNLGRVISDMPYGVMGVANNVEQLAASWAVAKAETGSAKGALAALVSGLSGPAGLLMVGVPIVTALAVAFGDDLVKAISSGSETLEQLDKRLAGIQQYKDFDLTVRIAGLDGIARLKLELDQLIAKKAFLEGANAKDAKVGQAGQWNIVSAMINPLAYGLMMRKTNETRNAADQDRNKFYSDAAQKIKAGKLSLGDTEDERMLTRYLKMSAEEAKKLIAANKINLDIAVKRSEIGKQEQKDREKADKAGARVGAKAEREAERVKKENDRLLEQFETLTSSSDALSKINEQYGDNLMLINQVMSRGLISSEKYAVALKSIEKIKNEALLKAAANNVSLERDIDSLLSSKKGVSMFGLSGKEMQVRDEEKQNRIASGITDVGSILQNQGIKIKGFDQFSSAYRSFVDVSKEQKKVNQDESRITLDRITGYAQLASGIGQMIGGSAGSAISTTASMASTGASIGTALAAGGGPIGAVIGGVIGLASSLFGGDGKYAEEKANRDQMRHDLYNNMVQSALSGGSESLKLLRSSGYNYDVLKNLPDSYQGSGGRLFEDRGVTRLQLLQEVLSVLDQAGQTINSFVRPGLISDLEKAKTLYEYSVAKVGSLAELTTAYWDTVAMSVTGISADTVGKMFESALGSSTSGQQAGRVFAETFEEQLVKSIKQMAIAQTINDAVMPYLSPVLKTMVSGMIDGSMTSGEMASLMSEAKGIAANIAPVVSSLYTLFDSAGLNGYTYTGQTDASTPITLEARANGGSIVKGRSYIVGERRPEIITAGADGFVTPYVPDGGSVDFERFLVEMKSLFSAGQQATISIDGQAFSGWMEKQRLKSETRIANGLSRTSKQVF